MLLSAQRSLLLVVDVQERLAPAMAGLDRVLANLDVLLRAAEVLSVPVLATEQHPQGLGPTLPAVKARLAPPGITPDIMEKRHFSCVAEPGFAARLSHPGRDQIVVTGIECHVCVLQTALELHGAGHRVFVAADACTSRTIANAELGVARMRNSGVNIVSTEMVLFEWLHRAGTPAFKTLSALIR